MSSQNQNSTKNPKKNKTNLNNIAKYSGIGFQFIAVVGAGFYGGYQLDKYLSNPKPVFAAIFAFIGVVLGIYLALKDFIKK